MNRPPNYLLPSYDAVAELRAFAQAVPGARFMLDWDGRLSHCLLGCEEEEGKTSLLRIAKTPEEAVYEAIESWPEARPLPVILVNGREGGAR